MRITSSSRMLPVDDEVRWKPTVSMHGDVGPSWREQASRFDVINDASHSD